MKTVSFEGKTYKVYQVKCFGATYNIFLRPRSYTDGTLAVEALEIDSDLDPASVEPFAVLTSNLCSPLQSDREAFLKTYSENSWVPDFVLNNGICEYTGIVQPSGYCTFPLARFDFSKMMVQ